MTQIRRQRGSSLIMLLGITVTLAVLASALVVMIANAQHNTSRERSQAKSFHVAEAALDAAMANISPKWPSATPVPFPTATFQAEYAPALGETAEYPGPAGGPIPAVSVTYFDNQDWSGNGRIGVEDGQFDRNGDSKMFIVTQSGVLKRASRVQALVQRTYFEPSLPKENVLWCGGNVLNSGVGNGVMPKISVVDLGPLAVGTVAADVMGTMADYPALVNTDQVNAQFSGGPSGHNSPKTLEETFPLTAREGIIEFATLVSRYFDVSNASPGKTPLETALASPKNAYGGPGLAGLTVIRQSNDEVDLLGSTALNSSAEPGILMLLGGLGLHIGGTAEFFGFVYVEDGTITVEKGTPTIHGALFSTNDVDFRGNAQLQFDYTALSNFGGRWGSTVTMVPNTWRELRPQ